MDSTSDGISIVLIDSQKSSEGDTYPEAGNSFHWTDTTMMRMMPSQKLGMDMPDNAAMLAPISTGLPLRTAAMMPMGMPTSSAKNIAMAASCSVTGSFCAISVVTGTSVRRDLPRSPCRTCPAQAAYCIGNGSFRRYLSRR